MVIILFISGLVFAMGQKEEKQIVDEGAITVKLYIYGTGLLELDLEEYLEGVVAAEMPASFAIEALKAQAVSARTYTLKRLNTIRKNGSKYPLGADITNLPQEGQAWLSESERQVNWGSYYSINQRKIKEAVKATKDQVLVYDNQLAEALYCSTAGPYTEDAQEVFKVQAPYLKAQPNPYDRHSPRYKDQKTLTISEVQTALGVKIKPKELTLAANIPQGPDVVMASSLLEPWFNPDKVNQTLKILSRNRSGRVQQVMIGGEVFSGKEIRSKLGLRSTNFTFEVNADGTKLTFFTIGYGHGVGMSQYGADGMAKQGFNYLDILSFYYPGTEVVSLNNIRE